MWIKNLYGDHLINLSNSRYVVSSNFPVGSSSYSVMAIVDGSRQHVLFAGTADECQKYMAELEKELNEFGKLVKVELPVDSEKCTCGKGLDIEPPDHDPKCSFFVPF